MPKRKTKWPCGHTGYGQYCHLCKQVSDARRVIEDARQEKRIASLQQDVVDLIDLPAAHRQTARDIIRRIDNGQHWSRVGGRKLRSNDTTIIFDLGAAWRLIGQDSDTGFKFKMACSHQEYNNFLKGR